MGHGFNVQSDALRHYSKVADSAAGRIEAIRKRVAGLDIPEGAFGKLPESDNLKADYDTQSNESVEDLQNASDTLRAIADGIRESAAAYDANEDQQTKNFGG